MSLVELVDRIRDEPPYAPPGCPFPSLRLICRVAAPAEWIRTDLERELGQLIPDELAELWGACHGLVLFEDTEFRQAGTVLLSPEEAIRRNREYRRWRPDEVRDGDVVIGRFYGDSELLVLRADERAADHGSLVIAAEIDPRPDWFVVGASIESFLARQLAEHGQRHWRL